MTIPSTITDPYPRISDNAAIIYIYSNYLDSSNYAAIAYQGGTMTNGVLEFSVTYQTQ